MSGGLPEGWQSTTLREIAEIVGGVTKDAKKSSGQGFREVPYLRVANVQRGRLDLTEMKSIGASEADIQRLSLVPGDILLNEGGDRDKLGRGWIWQGQLPVCIHQNHVFRARLLSRDIDPVYVAHFTNSMAQSYFAEHGSQTTNLASISLTKLGSLPILLPPRSEQTRIVAKLEELLSDLDAGVAELKAAQLKLKQYRQSLLKAAVDGSLTAAWRARPENAEPEETGAQLLARILRERRARWEAAQLEKYQAQGKAPPKGWQDKYVEPVAPETRALPTLPNGWLWANVDQLSPGDLANGKSVPSAASGAKVLRLTAVRAGRIDLREYKCGAWTETEARQFAVAAGDILIVRGNGSLALVGRAGLVATVTDQIAYPDTMIRLRALDAVVDPAWLNLVWSTQHVRTHLEQRARTSAGIYKISQPDILSACIPVPPLAEQARIQQIVEEHDEAESLFSASLDAALAQSTAQRQNLLRAAFSGQLVPQDPQDEPASALLARIRAEREGLAQPKARKAVKNARKPPAKERA